MLFGIIDKVWHLICLSKSVLFATTFQMRERMATGKVSVL